MIRLLLILQISQSNNHKFTTQMTACDMRLPLEYVVALKRAGEGWRQVEEESRSTRRTGRWRRTHNHTYTTVKMHQSVPHTQCRLAENLKTVHLKAIKVQHQRSHVSNIWCSLLDILIQKTSSMTTITSQAPTTSRLTATYIKLSIKAVAYTSFANNCTRQVLQRRHNLEWQCTFKHVQHIRNTIWE